MTTICNIHMLTSTNGRVRVWRQMASGWTTRLKPQVYEQRMKTHYQTEPVTSPCLVAMRECVRNGLTTGQQMDKRVDVIVTPLTSTGLYTEVSTETGPKTSL